MTGNTLGFVSLIVAGAALLVAIYTVFQARQVRAWRKQFASPDQQPENLEDIITSMAKKIRALEVARATGNKNVAQIEDTLSHAVQKVGLLRFDSRVEEGGNLSFCLALLDHHNTGFVLTSMHGRMQNRIYAKYIERGSSEVQLSEEERDAVFKAVGSKPKQKRKTSN